MHPTILTVLSQTVHAPPTLVGWVRFSAGSYPGAQPGFF